MPAERLSMRKVREVLRLKYACGVSARVISRSLGIGRTVVAEYIRRAAVIGVTWPTPVELDDTALERKLFAQRRDLLEVIGDAPRAAWMVKEAEKIPWPCY